MNQAPVTIFVLNTLGSYSSFATTQEKRFYEWANIQSIGASIQNMLLTATDLGLSSLWNCDIFFAHQEIQSWLDTNEQVIACFSFQCYCHHTIAHGQKKGNRQVTAYWQATLFVFLLFPRRLINQTEARTT